MIARRNRVRGVGTASMAPTRPRTLLLVAMAMTPAMACAQEAGTQQDPLAALRSGDYEAAISGFERQLGSQNDAAVRRSLSDALVAVGRYAEAEELLREGDAEAMRLPLGRLLLRTGRLDEAEAVLTGADTDGHPDRLEARLALGRIALERGERDQAEAHFDTFFDAYNGSGRLTANDLAAVGHAVAHLGRADPDLYQDALRAFDEALSADPSLDEVHVAIGHLFLGRHVSGEAKAAFQAVLDRNPHDPEAKLGMAKAARFDGSRQAIDLTREALATNESLVGARVFLGLLLLELENFEAAQEEADRALDVNPRSLEALTVKAAARLLSGDADGFRAIEGRILELNPSYGSLYATGAELLARQRQYAGAAELARAGIQVDSTDADVRGHLAMNQLRIGRIDQGRANLEKAFEGDPHNVWYFNTLELLDDLTTFPSVRVGDFELVLHEREADLLALYVGAYAQEALDALSARYGMRPPTPIRLEVFPSHADFSVRTVGLAGLGALGVSFGSVLAMDSPSARDVGAFNWASTLWHEVAHSVHMSLSDHRVPRWFTEGCAVYEQRRAREGWGDPVSPSFVQALREDRLHPVSRLNEGFVRPSYPEHVVHSYFQASIVCEWIEDNHGFEALRAFLEGYRDGRSSPELIRSVLGTDPADLDRTFDRHLRSRFQAALESLTAPAQGGGRPAIAGSFRGEMRAGMEAFGAGDLDEAERAFNRAVALFPQYGGQDGPHRFLAQIHERRDDPDAAAGEWRQQLSLNENDRDAALQLARLEEARDRPAAAAEALLRTVEIHPYDAEIHERLAGLYEASDAWEAAVRERLAVLALEPVDRAEALYQLARAHWRAGDRDAARTRVLEALDIAPGFSAALDLLLEIRGGGG